MSQAAQSAAATTSVKTPKREPEPGPSRRLSSPAHAVSPPSFPMAAIRRYNEADSQAARRQSLYGHDDRIIIE